MTKMKLSHLFPRRVSSIFRRKKKNKDIDHVEVRAEDDDDSTTVNLENSDSALTFVEDFENPASVRVDSVVEKPKPRKTVTFSTVTVRHYDLILGDNPEIRYPLGLGWRYRKEESHKVDQFEEQREERESQALQDRIEPRLYVPRKYSIHYLKDVDAEKDYDDHDGHPIELNLYERRARLRAFGYTEAELLQAERKRVISLALEWPDDMPFPFNRQFIARYTK